MSEWAAVSLCGSPPVTLVTRGGQLTSSPSQAVFGRSLDEIEKAHPDVVQLLLQVLEEGRLTDS